MNDVKNFPPEPKFPEGNFNFFFLVHGTPPPGHGLDNVDEMFGSSTRKPQPPPSGNSGSSSGGRGANSPASRGQGSRRR